MPVWRREMRGNGYRARWVTADTDEGAVRALTFVANRAGERYAGRLSDEEIAGRIASACGHLGPNAEYGRSTQSPAAITTRAVNISLVSLRKRGLAKSDGDTPRRWRLVAE